MTVKARAGAPGIAINHVGLSVSDLERAVEWYTSVLGLQLIRGPIRFESSHSSAAAHRDVFGPEWGGVRISYLTGANGVGVELFQFTQPPAQRRVANFEYWLTGIFHVCVTTLDVPGLAADIAANGGRQRSQIHETRPGVHTCYCEDPDGNVLEITTASFEVQNANRTRFDLDPDLQWEPS